MKKTLKSTKLISVELDLAEKLIAFNTKRLLSLRKEWVKNKVIELGFHRWKVVNKGNTTMTKYFAALQQCRRILLVKDDTIFFPEINVYTAVEYYLAGYTPMECCVAVQNKIDLKLKYNKTKYHTLTRCYLNLGNFEGRLEKSGFV
jgi:hypothetical protein